MIPYGTESVHVSVLMNSATKSYNLQPFAQALQDCAPGRDEAGDAGTWRIF